MDPNALFSFIRSSKRNALPLLPNFGALPPSVCRDFIVAVGGRAGASFFACHRDYFVMTLNFTAFYLDLLPFRSFTVTLGYFAICRDWQKTRHRYTDGT
jgi:hypothetical protein